MMFRVAIIALVVSVVSALNDLTPNGEVEANSALGMRLLSQATVITPARQLNDQQEQRDVTFVANYAIRYLGCHSLIQVSAGNKVNYKNNEGGNMLYAEHLARFALCPTAGNCGKCEGGGEYVMNMETFVDAFTEAKLTEQEYACESVRENCACENANDDFMCELNCYNAAGLSNCVNDDSQQEFEVQRYLECKELDGGNNNNNGLVYSIGPYCSPKDGFSIHLGVFTDAHCNAITDPSIFASITGAELPYTSTSLVDSECHSCLKVNGENNEYTEPSDSCLDIYQNAAKCETKLDVPSKDESGCDFINYILPRYSAADSSSESEKIKEETNEEIKKKVGS